MKDQITNISEKYDKDTEAMSETFKLVKKENAFKSIQLKQFEEENANLQLQLVKERGEFMKVLSVEEKSSSEKEKSTLYIEQKMLICDDLRYNKRYS